jgi:hypothetical protein
MNLSLLDVSVNILVDRSSWDDEPCPDDILALQTPNPRIMKVEDALMHTALWTRPPSSQGFHLSDMWAWLRYRPAISDQPNLRLRPEWNDIDAHQKTILSDELGVGFTTCLFAEALDFQLYSDTLNVIRVAAPGQYTLKRQGKRGPAKSPDYIVRDRNNEVSVLECKGTQSSGEYLEQALSGGVAQKKNLNSVVQFRHKLVAGLFIPQTGSAENALIQVKDPEFDELSTILSNIPQTILLRSIFQIALAKHFALMGLYPIAAALSAIPTSELGEIKIPGVRPNDFTQVGDDTITTTVSHFVAPDLNTTLENQFQGVRFVMECPLSTYESLTNGNFSEELSRMEDNLLEHSWVSTRAEHRVEMKSPLSFAMTLEYI